MSLSKLESHFWRFHHKNPQVYSRLVNMGEDMLRRGYAKISIKYLIEVARYEHRLETNHPKFKIPNNTTPYYARLISVLNPAFKDAFQFGKQKYSATFGPDNNALPQGDNSGN